ncbi:MAG: hypothetical protein LBG92_01700 [Prevotellaceae bacterium]|jgi:hypothetical protein|nr:hypothetical protein [Prevotellaceae bacterium]
MQHNIPNGTLYGIIINAGARYNPTLCAIGFELVGKYFGKYYGIGLDKNKKIKYGLIDS